MPIWCWLSIFSILCFCEFGIYICSIVLISITSVVMGFLIVLLSSYSSEILVPSKPLVQNYKTKFKISGIPKIVRIIKRPPPKILYDKRLTGSLKVDEPLQEIINNVFRDFIFSWYTSLSSDDEFILHVKELLKTVINNLARSSIEVDWVSVFTKHVVDDFATHLRLFRKSEMALKKKNEQEQIDKHHNLESVFFDLELSIEKTLCRDIVSTSETYEKRYLLHLVDVLLFLLLPSEDFRNTLFRFFLRDLLAINIFQPTFASIADPDFINQNLIWLCKDNLIDSKAFLTVIRRTDCLDELYSIQEIANHELKVQKSKDSRSKDETKQNIKRITFVKNLSEQRYNRLLNGLPDNYVDSIDISEDIEYKDFIGPEAENKLISLPFSMVLNNNIGLHYFTEFMSSINAQGYVFFYHSIEGFRTTAETILSEKNESTEVQKFEKLREFAKQLFDAYLGENAAVKVKLNEDLLTKFHSKMTPETLNENFFDGIQSKIFDIMQDEFYNTSFKVSSQYIKLLAELELLPEFNVKDDESLSLSSSKSDDTEKDLEACLPSPDTDIIITELLGNELPSSEFCFPNTPALDDFKENGSDGQLSAEIYNTGITHHAGKTFAVYAIAVSYNLFEGSEERWFVVRRYREFHEFHKLICEKYSPLSSTEFPSKKAFNNLSRHLMEKRRHLLNEYLQFLLLPDTLSKFSGLQIMLYNFLEPRVTEKGKKSFVRTVGTFISPLKTSVKTVGSAVKFVPNTIFGIKDGLVKALTKSHNTFDPNSLETDKVSAGLDLDAEDIPLRIILLLMDEVFDLKSKDLWFRRRIIALVRQIIKTTQGDAINRKLKNYVDGMASANQVAEWLKLFNQIYWPKGILAETQRERDNSTKHRTRVAAKMLLLCSIPDELKHIIGSETSCKGAMIIFHLFQNLTLNRRLLYVLFEHLLIALFPWNNISKILEMLHCESPRISPLVPVSEDHFGDPKFQIVNEKLTTSKENISILSSKLKLKCKSQMKSTKQDLDHYLHKRRRSLTNLSQQNSDIQLKSARKRKKSLETAIFYTDISPSDKPLTDVEQFRTSS